jgi:putative Holliday junction resolvase
VTPEHLATGGRPDRPGRPGRAVGVDLGAKRIGIAVSDSAGTLATPRGTLVRTGDAERDRRALVDLVVEEEAVVVVVGHPLSLDGSRGPAAKTAECEADALAALLDGHDVAVELFDERLTTVSAHRALTAGGTRGRDQRAVVDRTAAAVLLMAWLDGRRAPR